jgi:lipopolysaccharide export system protein LptA
MLIFLPLIPASFLGAQSNQGPSKEESKAAPIVIQSNSLEIDNKKRIIIFKGEVDAKEKTFNIQCDELLLYYIEASAPVENEDPNLKVDRIVARGRVKIIRPEGGSASAEHAVYYQAEERVVLTGNPIVSQGDDFIEGERITLFMRESRSVVEGSKKRKVKAVVNSIGDKENPIGIKR